MFIHYYKDLKKNNAIELLMIGQHHYEVRKDFYSFMLEDKSMEHVGLVNAMLQGMDTGLFDVVAHPDMNRKNHYCKEFWKLVPEDERIVYGCDAHATDELILAHDIKTAEIHLNASNKAMHRK